MRLSQRAENNEMREHTKIDLALCWTPTRKHSLLVSSFESTRASIICSDAAGTNINAFDGAKQDLIFVWDAEFKRANIYIFVSSALSLISRSSSGKWKVERLSPGGVFCHLGWLLHLLHLVRAAAPEKLNYFLPLPQLHICESSHTAEPDASR